MLKGIRGCAWCVLFFCFRFGAIAQEPNELPLELGESSGPVAISGTMVFTGDGSQGSPYSFQVRASAKNTGYLPVLFFKVAFEIYFDAHPKLRNHFYQNDYFFSPSPLEPGESKTIDFSVDHYMPSKQHSSWHVIRASAVLDFAQFTDGTTWGDSDLPSELSRDRRLTMDELRILKEAYSESDDQAFTKELLRASGSLPALSGLQNVYRTKGLEKAKSTAWSMIESAEQHARELTWAMQGVMQ